ncbi:hypothetical protein PIB30_036384, partial [Stylosanthes scabra]|nr:hypothetical protein [Stylosanthes scabra]
KPDVRSAKYHDGPSFSLGPDFNTPTPSPDGTTSKDAEVLDIPPIREILPENIVLNAEENPCTIRLKPLTSEEEKKIYNLAMYGSKGNNLQEEKIAMWRGDVNFFLIRGELRFLRPKGWIDDKMAKTLTGTRQAIENGYEFKINFAFDSFE